MTEGFPGDAPTYSADGFGVPEELPHQPQPEQSEEFQRLLEEDVEAFNTENQTT